MVWSPQHSSGWRIATTWYMYTIRRYDYGSYSLEKRKQTEAAAHPYRQPPTPRWRRAPSLKKITGKNAGLFFLTATTDAFFEFVRNFLRNRSEVPLVFLFCPLFRRFPAQRGYPSFQISLVLSGGRYGVNISGSSLNRFCTCRRNSQAKSRISVDVPAPVPVSRAF
jgi:hypothetical protein